LKKTGVSKTLAGWKSINSGVKKTFAGGFCCFASGFCFFAEAQNVLAKEQLTLKKLKTGMRWVELSINFCKWFRLKGRGVDANCRG